MYIRQRKLTALVTTITVSIILCFLASIDIAHATDKPYIDYIEVKGKEYIAKCWPPAIGCDSQSFRAITHMSDGTIATGDEYKDVQWLIERYDNVTKTYTTVKTGEGETINFWQPYGSKPGQYKVTARSKVEPDATGFTWYQLDYPWYTETFCIFYPGEVKDGKILTRSGDVAANHSNEIKAADIKETYNWDTDEYTCILPDNPYTANDYTFVGWKKDGVIYKPGDKLVISRSSVERNAYFEAQWEPNFKTPNLVVNKAGKKKIKLSWTRMIGGKGYRIYRVNSKNGKYKLIKTIKNNKKTQWTDKSIEAGKTYYYKVAPYKKVKGKLVQKKSGWAATSTKAGKVKSVKLNKSSVKGKVGKKIKLKAKIKTSGGKKLSNELRWCSSNSKVAKVNQKTGEVTFKKSGTCRIWAKAYNGKESVKIKVTVIA